jgi:hypothetical protein
MGKKNKYQEVEEFSHECWIVQYNVMMGIQQGRYS